jgi:uncharacterized membrane protein YoaK (UPF0700 family)
MDARPDGRTEDDIIRRSLFGLTVVTGIVDATSYLGLGQIFTANMTGNLVFVGFAIGGDRRVSVVRSMTALLAFACGAVCGGRIKVRAQTRARSLQMATGLECVALLCAVSPVAWNRVDSPVATIYAAIVLTAIAMGLQNAVARGLGVPDLTTTVLTLTITGLAADSSLGGGSGGRTRDRVTAVATMGAGSALGTMLLHHGGIAVALGAAALIVGALSLILHVQLKGRPELP